MTPQLGSTSSRAVFFLFFLSAAAFVPPARSAPPACSAANMPTGPTAFIATSPNLVTVLDASANSVACTIMVGNGPTNLAVSPDSSQLFVENDADATITAVTLADPSVPANISTVDLKTHGVTAPMTANLAISPDNTKVYVVSLPATLSASTQASLNVITLPSLTVSAAVSVITSPAIPVTAAGLGVAFTPDASKAYIATEGATYVVTTSTDSVAPTPITASGGTAAVQQTGTFAYVVDVVANPSTISQITTANNAVLTQTLSSPGNVCTGAYATAITPDSSLVYYTCPGSGFVQSIPAATNASVTATVPLSLTGGKPQGIAITSDGASAYVANSNGSISIVSVSGNSATNTSLGASALSGIGFRPVRVSVTSPAANSLSVPVNATFQFIANAQFAFNPSSIIWKVNGTVGGNILTVGSISNTGLYKAPAAAPVSAVTVTATSPEVPVNAIFGAASVTLTVTTPAITVSPVTPASASVDINGTDLITATINNDSSDQGVTWAVNGSVGGDSTHGTIASANFTPGTATATYTAPKIVPSPSSITITATSVADSTVSGSTALTVTSSVTVNVAPPAGAPPFLINQTYQFTATTPGDSNNLGVTWSLGTCNLTVTANNPLPCGMISATGLYTAPKIVTPPNAVTIQATSIADPSKTGTLQITITSSVIVNVAPPTGAPPFLINQTYQFTATTPGDNNNLGVTWSLGTCNLTVTANNPLPCGTIVAATGVYTAPPIVTTANAVTIQATSKADPSKIGTFQSTITSNVAITGFQVNSAAPPAQLVIETASYTLTPVITGETGLGVIWSILSCSVANPATSSCGKFADAKAGTYVPPPIVPYATPVTPSSTASVAFQATSVADPTVSKTFTINIGSTIQLSMPASISNVLIGGSVDFTPKTTGGNVTLFNDTNQGVTLAITGTCFAPPNFGTSSTIPCGSFTGNSYSAPTVVPLASAPPVSLSQATKAQITVTATSLADPVRVASTTFVISSNISFTVLLGVDTTTLQNTGPTAASPTLAVGGPTSGYNTANYLESNAAGFGSVTGLNWQATAGNIQAASGNQSATYTSPAALPNPATVTITGFAIADFTKTATASIPIVASKFVYANANSIGSTVQITIPSNASSGSLNLDFLGPTSGQIALACSNFVQLTNSSCSFSPSATASSSATGKTLVTLTLSVTRSGGAYLRPPLAPGTPLPGLPGSVSVITLLTLLILAFAAKNRIRFLWAPASRWNRAFAVLLLCAVVLTWAAACGQFSQPNTPTPPIPPTQTATGSVTVTGTPTTNSSASTDSLVVMVQVN
jgi:DNA-binding beta-propeller fold protein YncE